MSLWGQDCDHHPSLQTGRLRCSKVKSIVPSHRWWVAGSNPEPAHCPFTPDAACVCRHNTPLSLRRPRLRGLLEVLHCPLVFWKPTSKVPGPVSLIAGSAMSVCFQPCFLSGCPRRFPSALTLETTWSVLGMLMSVNPVGKSLPHRTHLLSPDKQVPLQRDSPGPWILHSGSSLRTRVSFRWAYS